MTEEVKTEQKKETVVVHKFTAQTFHYMCNYYAAKCKSRVDARYFKELAINIVKAMGLDPSKTYAAIPFNPEDLQEAEKHELEE